MTHTHKRQFDRRARDRKHTNARSLKNRICSSADTMTPWERDDLPNQLLLDIVVEDCATSRQTPAPRIEIPRRVLEGY